MTRGREPSARASDRAETDRLVDHFFRHEAAKLVALLTRAFGLRHLDLVEDVVQSALLQALETWKLQGNPKDPGAWVYRVARNKALDAFRRQRTVEKYAPDVAWLANSRTGGRAELDQLCLESEIRDSQLRMLFACCHPELPAPSQVAVALKILCGFSIREIARALLTREANLKKRLYRGKRKLTEPGVEFAVPAGADLAPRLDSVHSVLYLLFNEGYNSQHPNELIRRDLTEEAIRLCHQLAKHPICRTPQTHALLALMLFHAARFDARLDSQGGILLLEDQDRSRWQKPLIVRALEYLDTSAAGTEISRYHLEAGIAAQHCLAPSFAATDWPAIRELYDRLLDLHPSPIGELNRAIVVAQIEGPRAGISAIEGATGLRTLGDYHLLDATLGELHLRDGQVDRARDYFAAASSKTRSLSERRLLVKKLHACG
ncbi:MAG: sigma-70 family RNA polymerase sigma factor [Acidobacteriota bacterium]